MKKISIILPVHNGENTLRHCISSLQNQTLDDIEIICVDDCSTDASREIIKGLQSIDRRITLIEHAENKGTFCTRKTGVLSADSEYTMFCDQDDYYSPDACERLYREITDRNTDILMYDVSSFHHDENGCVVHEETKWLKTKPETYHGDNCLSVFHRITLLWNKIIKTSVCRQAFGALKMYILHSVKMSTQAI